MTSAGQRRKFLGRHSVRTRIALAFAGLFLVTVAAFVVAITTLVDRTSPAATSHGNVPANLFSICKEASGSPHPRLDPTVLAQCQYFLGADTQRAGDIHQLIIWSFVGMGIATIVAGLLGWAIAARILLPLRTVTAAARRASTEHLDERINLDGPDDELKELADTFDDMLTRLDLAFASQRRFVANASHELRTPLTSMRTLIDVAMAKPSRTTEQLEVLVGRVRVALDQSEALIDGLLTLARSDRGLTSRELVDLEAAAQDAIDQVSTEARGSNVAIDAELSPSPTIGDRVLVERLVANLLDNAVRYNVVGGTVKVVTETDNITSRITVTNTGPTVPPDAVDSLLEPFRRMRGADGDTRGVGLGLSIVASVVTAHGGKLVLEALPDGGLSISVALRAPKEVRVLSNSD